MPLSLYLFQKDIIMPNHKINGNNGHTASGPLGNEKLKFPVSYRLKAVLEASLGEETDKQKLESVFDSLQIAFAFHDHRPSSKGNYISYTYQVTLHNRPQMLELYEKLKDVEGLKFAL